MTNEDYIKKEFSSIKLEEQNYEYNYLTSSTSPDLYCNCSEEQIISAHLMHIISEMKEEGWYLIACKGEINEYVIGKFLFQKAKVK